MAVKGRAVIEKKNVQLGVLKIEYVPLESIHPNAYNPNRQSDHDFGLLCQSMREDGFTQPIIVQRATGEIVDGEHRWRAAHQLNTEPPPKGEADMRGKLGEIPVVYTDMAPEQMRIATLRHNRARGSEDVELTAQVLRDLEALGALGWAQDSLMMDDTELQALLNDIPAPDALADEEFGQAWEPGAANTSTPSDANGNGRSMEDMTPQALTQIRKQEAAIAAAKTDADRQTARKDNEVFRLALMYTGDEAVIVKQVLGQSPAQMLLQLCQGAASSTA